MLRLRKKSENWLCRRGIHNPQAQWLILFQAVCSMAGTVLVLGSGRGWVGLGFGTGALLATVNFFVLARLVPQLIEESKGSIVALVASFYLRLLLAALVLFLAIVGLGLPPVAVLAGLSTILVTFMVWTGKYIATQQHKEA